MREVKTFRLSARQISWFRGNTLAVSLLWRGNQPAIAGIFAVAPALFQLGIRDKPGGIDRPLLAPINQFALFHDPPMAIALRCTSNVAAKDDKLLTCGVLPVPGLHIGLKPDPVVGVRHHHIADIVARGGKHTHKSHGNFNKTCRRAMINASQRDICIRPESAADDVGIAAINAPAIAVDYLTDGFKGFRQWSSLRLNLLR